MALINFYLVIMGVSGSGKTTVGKLLAERLNARFIEGDDYHSAGNILKMSQGEPLDEQDRLPWLMCLRALLQQCIKRRQSVVLSCSALRRPYRNILREAGPQLQFVFLDVAEQVLEQRLKQRKNHFMKAYMLQSQLEALQKPEVDERDILWVTAGDATDVTLQQIIGGLF